MLAGEIPRHSNMGFGGSSIIRGAARVTFWGAAAMGITSLIGWLFGVSTA